MNNKQININKKIVDKKIKNKMLINIFYKQFIF